MMRTKRAALLNKLLMSQDGLAELRRIYVEVCQPDESDPQACALGHELMIDGILEEEFPTGVVHEMST